LGTECSGCGAAPPATLACRSTCEVFAAAEYCCSGVYVSPATCAPTPYSRFFKAACRGRRGREGRDWYVGLVCRVHNQQPC
jgi:hypothetical protein